jgi:hypothetical protein
MRHLLGVYFDFMRMEDLGACIFFSLFFLEHFHEVAVTFKKTSGNRLIFFLKLVESEFCNPTDFLCNSTDLTDNSIFRQMVSHTPPKEPRVA